MIEPHTIEQSSITTPVLQKKHSTLSGKLGISILLGIIVLVAVGLLGYTFGKAKQTVNDTPDVETHIDTSTTNLEQAPSHTSANQDDTNSISVTYSLEAPAQNDPLFTVSQIITGGVQWEHQPHFASQDISFPVANSQTTRIPLKGLQVETTLKTEYEAVQPLQEVFTAHGWEEDWLQSADGPGSSSIGYKKTNEDGTVQFLQYSYGNQDLAPDQDGVLNAECPCNYKVSLFISEPVRVHTAQTK